MFVQKVKEVKEIKQGHTYIIVEGGGGYEGRENLVIIIRKSFGF